MEVRRIAGEGAYRGMEENTMAMLDNYGFNHSKFSHHLKDDRLAFLEAVRTASLLSDNGTAPTRKMSEAIFHILRDVDSLDLIMESYQLLIELHKHFPRFFLSKEQSESSSSSPSVNLFKFIVVQEVWLPFRFGLDTNERNEANNPSRGSVDSLGFHSLIQEVATVDKERKSEVLDLMFLKNMLLLQYLIIVLEGDFLPRNCAFKEELNWTFLRESLVNMLLGSRKILYKSLIKDCLLLMHVLSQETMSFEDLIYHESSSMESSQEVNTAVTLALPEVKKSTCAALKKFFLMIMELDSSRSSADMQGLTTRADGVRTQVVEIILDELIYDNDIRCSFLQEEVEVEEDERSDVESEEESEDEPEKQKGAEGVIQIENPNLAKPKNLKARDVDMEKTTELSRREREEIEKQKAHERYMKLQEQGKTEQARKDLDRLALIRQQRAEAAKKREEEKAAKEQKKSEARK